MRGQIRKMVDPMHRNLNQRAAPSRPAAVTARSRASANAPDGAIPAARRGPAGAFDRAIRAYTRTPKGISRYRTHEEANRDQERGRALAVAARQSPDLHGTKR